MADAGEEETREMDSAEPSVAAVVGDLAGEGDGAPGGEDKGGDARPPDSAPAGGAGPKSGESPGTDGDDMLHVRDEGPEAPLGPNPEDIRSIRTSSRRQSEAAREDASEKAAEVVRTEVRRILGVDGRSDFEAESVQHVMGLARDGERVDPELEKELRAELGALGVNLDGVRLRYESMSTEDRRQLTAFDVQQAFLRVVDRVDGLATQASVSLGHRIRIFEREAKDYRKLFAGLRVLLEGHQNHVEKLVVGFRDKMEKETEGLEQAVREGKSSLTGKVKDLQTAFGDVGGHLKSCENRAREITERLVSAGAAVAAVEQEAARVMNELQRVASSGLAVRRLALLGGVIGSAVGGFFAFVLLLLLWAATSG